VQREIETLTPLRPGCLRRYSIDLKADLFRDWQSVREEDHAGQQALDFQRLLGKCGQSGTHGDAKHHADVYTQTWLRLILSNL
jgi:hypothetical protein